MLELVLSCFTPKKMARMHSRRKGKSSSKKPLKDKKPTWVRYEKKEIEAIITKLAKSGATPSQIGTILRDTYGIPDVKLIVGKTITSILKEANLLSKLPEDLTFLIKKEITILKHLETNKKDNPSKRGLQITASKIKRLAKYYKRKGKIPANWQFDRENIKLLLE